MGDVIKYQYHVFGTFLEENRGQIEDIKTQYIKLLAQLTSAPDISTEVFSSNMEQIHKMGCVVIATQGDYSTSDLVIVGSGTAIIEPKIIRGGKSVGHVEDIVVSSDHRGSGIAQVILERLKVYCAESNCYKIILDCDENVQRVYEKSGFAVKGLQMGVYL